MAGVGEDRGKGKGENKGKERKNRKTSQDWVNYCTGDGEEQ